MLIVLFDPTLPSCQRFFAQNPDLPCRKWNVQHPLVRQRLQRSIRSRAIQSLPTVIDINVKTQEASFYCHELAFVHAQNVRMSMSNIPIPAPAPMESLNTPSSTTPSVGMEILGVPPQDETDSIADSTDKVNSQAPINTPDMFTSEGELEHARNNKSKPATATELAAQMRLQRDQEDETRGIAGGGSRPGPLPPPPVMNVGVEKPAPDRAVLGATEVMVNSMRQRDPPGLGMEPGQ
jgi:hypothetical protein